MDTHDLLPPPGTRVAAALSGGVDSATAAARLLDAGCEVIGLTMQLWDHGHEVGGQRTCCALEDVQDARRVAQTLGIPFYVVNLEEAFRQTVVAEFLASGVSGATPNPCARCNQVLKFTHLLHKALEIGAEFLATGHYARRARDAATDLPTLLRAVDPVKDQSYFLFATPLEKLGKLLFPVGGMAKEETRALARRFGLHVAPKRESQDLCFLPDGDHAAFLARHAPAALTPGPIVEAKSGRVLGRHKGLGLYTVGQRKGLGVSHPLPLFVLALDPAGNRLLVGEEPELFRNQWRVAGVNWLLPAPILPMAVEVKIRHATPARPGRVEPADGEFARVRMASPEKAVTPGQACVFYQGQRLLGGGWILPD